MSFQDNTADPTTNNKTCDVYIEEERTEIVTVLLTDDPKYTGYKFLRKSSMKFYLIQEY